MNTRGGIAPLILTVGFTPPERASGAHRMGSYSRDTASMDATKNSLLDLLGIQILPPAVDQAATSRYLG